ncbi:MAG: topoisomerase C-terminal repeat-containing protein, partial [Fibrobacter sp.]|nr:topoisomerase C-terminal repeat-containing protein [Fibrobacter sp.]
KKGDSGLEAGVTGSAENDSSANSGEGGNSDDITNMVEKFPEWNIGDKAPFDSLELQKKKKSKPKYYTEATLLAAMKTAGKQIDNEELAEAMKDRGLGTPATQAGIIETLKKRGFIEARKNNLVSTPRGREVIALMDEKIKSPEMTGEWEYRLSQVEKGSLEPKEFRDGIMDYVRDLFTHLHEKYGSQFERETVSEAIPCPKCKQPMEIAPWGYVCKNAECGLKIGHTIAGRTLSHAEMQNLLSTGETPVLDGFVSKKSGKNFSARLQLKDDYSIEFKFESDGKFHGTRTDYKCPLCSCPLEENKNTLFCTGVAAIPSQDQATPIAPDATVGASCGFTLFKTIAGHTLTASEIDALFTSGKTPVIDDFKSKSGNTFAASLKWSENGRTQFEFLHRDFPCPACGDQLRFCKGSDNDGHNLSAYVCRNTLCHYGIPQVFYQRKFTDDEIEGLLKNKYTPVLEVFKKNDTKFRAALEIREGGKLAFNKLTVEVIEK